MAINPNLTRSPIGKGRAAPDGGDEPPPRPPARPPAPRPAAPAASAGIPQPVAPPRAPQPQPPAPAGPAQPFRPAAALSPAATALATGILTRPPLTVFRTFPLILAAPKTTTQIAQGAINLLNSAAPAIVQEAINTIRNRNIAPANLMNHLERKVIIGQVLNDLARDWPQETKQDFAEAFQTTADKLDVMDAIVSLAILNDPDLDNEIIGENMPETTETDLLENRRIVWQHPPPGTLLQPPYMVLLAVEHRETARAEEVVRSIMAALTVFQGFKVPAVAAQKLR